MSTQKGKTRLQMLLPGYEPPTLADELQRRANAPLGPKAGLQLAQKPCDFGLFGDEHTQTDLIDMLRKVKP